MSDPKMYAGIVPSSGTSTRMGRDKGLLEIGGSTFLRRTVTALRGGGCDPVLVVVADGEDALAAEGKAAGARVLVNPDPGEGPITSLRIALQSLDNSIEGVAYLPVDHPLVGADVVRELLERACSTQAALTLPVHGLKRGHPAVFGKALFPELLDPALDGGARIVVHRHLSDAELVEVDDPGVVIDIDTPSAYEAVLAGELDPLGGTT